MKSIVFDAGSVISLTTNNLLWVLKGLKEKFNGDFNITDYVKKELVTKPLKSKKFKFEALQVLRNINKGILSIVNVEELDKKTEELYYLANNSFYAFGNPIQIVHHGEISSLALAIITNAEALVVDERSTRKLVENPESLVEILKRKLDTKIDVNRRNLDKFAELTRGVKMIRSVELIIVAYDFGLLSDYIAEGVKDPKKELLDALLWGLKLHGCAISEDEINRIINLEK